MAIEICRFTEDHATSAQAFAERVSATTLAHFPAWQTVLTGSLGHRDRSLIALGAGELCGVLPLMHLRHWLFGTFYVSLPWLDYGGVLADTPETAQELLDAAAVQARADGAAFIELRSVKPVFPGLVVRGDKVTFLLPLEDADSVWRGLEAKVRNQVRKAQRAGLVCEFGREDLLPEFYGVFARNMRDLGTPVWGIALFENILHAFPKTSEIGLVRLGDKAIGGGLVLSCKDTVYMPSASSLREHFHLCPNNLLYWEVIKRACESGFHSFDFGRSTVGSGTYHFKKQWGAAVKPLHWQYVVLKGKKMPQLNPSNPRLKILIELWKRLPVGIANRLGPRIVRHLP